MLSMASALQRIKGRVTDSVPADLITELCRQLGHRWRDRDLGPVVTTHLFIQQILHGNTAASELRLISGLSFTPSAYCQARSRLPLELLQRLQQAVTGHLQADGKGRAETLWHGHRTFLIDGSNFSMPDTDVLREQFGQHKGQAEGCGFPRAHLMALFDARRGYLLHASVRPMNSHDMSVAPATHSELSQGDVLVGDKAFACYSHLALCRQREVHAVFRAHQRQIIDFCPGRPHRWPRGKGSAGMPTSRWLKSLGSNDQLVEMCKPQKRPDWMLQEDYDKLPKTLVVRELRYRVDRPGNRTQAVTLVTTLLDSKAYPAHELAKLYGMRWSVQTNRRHLKETMKMEVLRSQSVLGVQKEVAIFALVYNLVRRVMEEAGQRQALGCERISFVDALRWLRQARPGEQLPSLLVNPERTGRAEPRVRKRRPKSYPLMRKPRKVLRQALLDTSKDS